MDSLSKKLLNHMNKSTNHPSTTYYDFGEDLDSLADTLGTDSESLRAAVRYLESNGYIAFMRTQHGAAMSFYLDHRGLHWKEFRREEILQYVLENWIDFLAMLFSLVSIVIAVISLTR